MHASSTRKSISVALAAALSVSSFAATPSPAPVEDVQVVISSTAPGASVSIDGVPRGTTPVETALAPGKHYAAVRTPGAPASWTEFEVDETSDVIVLQTPAPTCAVLVRSSPEGASVVLDGATVGTTPVLLPAVAAGDREFLVEAQGWKPQRLRTSLRAPEPVLLDVALVSSSAALQIASEPAGGEVSVNGVPRGKAPVTVSGIPEGDAVVEISLPGYRTWLRTMQLSSGDSVPLNAVLEPMPSTLAVSSIPDGARIYVDDAFSGQAPVVLEGLKSGSHRIRAELPDHDPMFRTVNLAPGAKASEEFRLHANVGSIRLSTAPAGVSVLVDGKEIGRTSAPDDASDTVSTELMLAGILAGQRKISFVRHGWTTIERDAVVERDKILSLGTVRLERDLEPDTLVETRSGGAVRGTFLEKSDGFYRLETQHGVIRSIPLQDIVRIRLLRSNGDHLDVANP